MKKPVIVSGMQPTGQPHLGNYLGAIKNWVEIQNSQKYRCFFFVADYHSLTENYHPQEKRRQILDLAADFFAAGLDPEQSTVFVQSQVPECTELTWIFNTLTPIAELERMTQYKDKAGRQQKNINVGLFDYPVLQAADILIYHGELVPVGQDQIQHVEITRDTVRWFNHKYQTQYFAESQPLLTANQKIMSLLEPQSKMSKSLGDKHWIGIGEEPEAIEKKLAKAVTTPEGVANLKSIYQAFREKMPGEFLASNMAETKKIITQGLTDYFADFRQKKKALLAEEKKLLTMLKSGQDRARPIAQQTLQEVKEIIGLKLD